ncbi:MAG TPA: hypothetical protein VGH02_08045, partial [Rhizomicrobium sp.]
MYSPRHFLSPLFQPTASEAYSIFFARGSLADPLHSVSGPIDTFQGLADVTIQSGQTFTATADGQAIWGQEAYDTLNSTNFSNGQ